MLCLNRRTDEERPPGRRCELRGSPPFPNWAPPSTSRGEWGCGVFFFVEPSPTRHHASRDHQDHRAECSNKSPELLRTAEWCSKGRTGIRRPNSFHLLPLGNLGSHILMRRETLIRPSKRSCGVRHRHVKSKEKLAQVSQTATP